MKWLNHINIRKKLIGCSLVMIALSLIVGLVGLHGMSVLQGVLDNMAETGVPGIEALQEIKTGMANVNASIWEIRSISGGTASSKDDLYADINAALDKANAAGEIYMALPMSGEEAAAWESFDTEWKSWSDACNTMMERFRERDAWIESGGDADQGALINSGIDTAVTNVRNHFLSAKTLLEELASSNRRASDEYFEISKKRASGAKLVLIASIAVGVFVSLFLGFTLSSNLNDSLKKTLDMIQTMHDGDLTKRLNVDARDEIGTMAKTMDRYAEKLSGMLLEIYDAADQVASGSDQIAAGSRNLSKGTTEQAAAIEELTASVGQIAVQIRSNAENAGEANRLSGEAMNNASSGDAQMREMLGSMDEISRASGSIAKIIRVIDDIAFQTNILALNAAIEAVRAGQHGKGFAVVAEEVRSLAARSAQAAKETTELIESSINKVSNGTKIANETAKSLRRIVEDISKAAGLIRQIAVATNEQAAGIAQIDRGIEQVSSVVQANSASAEQSASASGQLRGQALALKDMVGRFKLGGHSKAASFEPARSAHEPSAAARRAPAGTAQPAKAESVKEAIPPPVPEAVKPSGDHAAAGAMPAGGRKSKAGAVKQPESAKAPVTVQPGEKPAPGGKDKKTARAEEDIVINLNDADFGKYS